MSALVEAAKEAKKYGNDEMVIEVLKMMGFRKSEIRKVLKALNK